MVFRCMHYKLVDRIAVAVFGWIDIHLIFEHANMNATATGSLQRKAFGLVYGVYVWNK